MTDWAGANARLRADRDALNETKRREAEAHRAAEACICTAGHVCRHNAACPRLTRMEAVR